MSSIVPETKALLFHESRAFSFPKKGTFSLGTKACTTAVQLAYVFVCSILIQVEPPG